VFANLAKVMNSLVMRPQFPQNLRSTLSRSVEELRHWSEVDPPRAIALFMFLLAFISGSIGFGSDWWAFQMLALSYSVNAALLAMVSEKVAPSPLGWQIRGASLTLLVINGLCFYRLLFPFS
jgi:hypothetical protein